MESPEELKEKLYQEKLKRANSNLARRLVVTVIGFVILLTLLVKPMEEFGAIVQWICIFIYFGAGYWVVGLIVKCYKREEDEAIRVKQPNWRRK